MGSPSIVEKIIVENILIYFARNRADYLNLVL